MRGLHKRRSASDRLDAVFAALSDPTRRTILARLARKELSVTQLWQPLSISVPAVSRHLRILEAAGLISRIKRGRVHYCRARASDLRHASDWLLEQRTFQEQRPEPLARRLDEKQA